MKKTLLIIILAAFNITQAQIVNIPDANFKSALLNHEPTIDTNNDGEIQISEAESVYWIYVNNRGINDLTGIEYFINLTELDCASNQLSTLDINYNENLFFLNCFYNQLTTLDISNNLGLEILWCSFNQLTTLNVSNNTNLIDLECDDNQLTTLHVSNNSNLKILACNDNLLTTLDVSNNLDLVHLTCNDNQVNTLDVNNSLELFTLNCSNNQLAMLNVSNNINLTKFRCNGNIDLTYVNLKNGNNLNLNILGGWNSSEFENLPNLTTVCVDELNTDLTTFITTETGHSINFTTNCALEVKETVLLDFSVYPTPTKNSLYVKSKTEIKKIVIYNKIGELIVTNTTKNQIDISNLANGLYFVKVEDINGNVGIKKVVKN